MANGHGGYREGAGRKPADYVPSQDKLDYDREKALHEKIKRRERELKLARAMREVLPRDVQAQAAATAVAIMVQSLRSIPDTLERVAGLTPQQAEIAQKSIDEALTQLSVAFKAMVVEEPPIEQTLTDLAAGLSAEDEAEEQAGA